MAEPGTRAGLRPSPTKLVAGALVLAGFALSGLSWWFFLLTALGTLGPGLLRELGVLSDKDELQRQADHRAGYHAFLTAGFLAFALVSWIRSSERVLEHAPELATLFLVVLWFTWLFSSLTGYWGARATARRLLLVFGAVVLAFTIVSNLGSEWTGWTALLLHPLIALPFFALAWLAGRLPRVAGVLLLATAAFFFSFFGFFQRENLAPINEAVTTVLLLGPLLASGIALLASGGEDGDDDELASPRD